MFVLLSVVITTSTSSIMSVVCIVLALFVPKNSVPLLTRMLPTGHIYSEAAHYYIILIVITSLFKVESSGESEFVN